MKHLLNGVMVAAALAIAAPVWAQAPMTPGAPARAPAAAPAAPMAGAGGAQMAAPQRHHRRHMRKVARRGGRMRGGGGGDSMANQLNREELSRIQSGGGMPPQQMQMQPQMQQMQGNPYAGPRPSGSDSSRPSR